MTLTDAIEIAQLRYDGLGNGSIAALLLMLALCSFPALVGLFSYQKPGFIESLFSSNVTAKLRVTAWGATGVLLVASVVALNLGTAALSEHRAAEAAYAKVAPFLDEHYGLTFNQEYGPSAFFNGTPTEAKLNGEKALVQLVGSDSEPRIAVYHGETLHAK